MNNNHTCPKKNSTKLVITDWYQRGVAEAIYVQQESPSLNRGQEKHILPAIYNELLPNTSSRDSETSDSHVTGEAKVAV